MYGQPDGTSNTTLLQKNNLIINNSISETSAPIDQSVVSIVNTENQPGSNPIAIYSHPQWNSQQIGNLTKSIYDEEGNIYVAASSAYVSENKINSWRYGDIGGGEDDLNAAGAIYRLDAYTGEATIFNSLPQQRVALCPIIFMTFSVQRLTGPGIADIAYDYENKQILTANNEDGKIYRTDKSGTLINEYDPGLADDGAVGFAPEPERITAIATQGNQVYYAISDSISSYIASYKIKNNQEVLPNSEQIEIMLSDILELTNPNFPITNINLAEGNLMAITQNNMLNEVTILPDNLPTIILKKSANKWQFEKLFDGSTEQLELRNKSNVQMALSEEVEETQLWYAGSDLYENNYLLHTNVEVLPDMSNPLTANYSSYQLPGLLGAVKNVQFVKESKLLNSVLNNENQNEGSLNNGNNNNNNNGDDDENENSKIEPRRSEVEIYPNPADTYFQIKNLSSEDIKAIYLYNLAGELLKFSDKASTIVNVNDIEPGVYIVKVKTADNLSMKKVLVK